MSQVQHEPSAGSAPADAAWAHASRPFPQRRQQPEPFRIWTGSELTQ